MKLDKRGTWSLIALALLALVTAMPLQAQTEVESGPEEFESSAGWGIDRDTGRIAIDPGLVFFYDPEVGTLVVGPDYADDALETLGATDRGNGTWVLADGTSLSPVLGEVAIDFGYGPDEMYAALSLPLVALDRVELVKAVSANSERKRVWRQCKNCSDFGCPVAGLCDVNVLYSNLSPPARVGSCKFKLFKSCHEKYIPVCIAQVFQCINCQGAVTSTGTLDVWACNDGC